MRYQLASYAGNAEDVVLMDTVAPYLVGSLAHADASVQRRIAVAAAELVVERTHLTAAELEQGLAALRAGTYRDSAARTGIHDLTERLNETCGCRTSHTRRTLAAFSVARASSAVHFALDADPRAAALEALYEPQSMTWTHSANS